MATIFYYISKIKLLNIFKDHHIVEKFSIIAVGNYKWALSNVFWMELYSRHGKHNLELNECSHMH